MKKILLMAALFIIGTYSVTSAQGQSKYNSPANRKQIAEDQSVRMQKTLNLTTNQKKEVYDVNMEYLKKVEEARNNKQLKMQDVHAEREGKLKTILTKEQYDKWKSNTKVRSRAEGQKVKAREPQVRNKTTKDTNKGAN